MIVFLSILIVILLALLIVSVWFNVKLGRMLIKFEDNIQQSLDIIDSSYKRISRILELPLTFDDPYVRQIINELKSVREAVLLIARKISLSDEDEQQDKKDDDDTDD